MGKREIVGMYPKNKCSREEILHKVRANKNNSAIAAAAEDGTDFYRMDEELLETGLEQSQISVACDCQYAGSRAHECGHCAEKGGIHL